MAAEQQIGVGAGFIPLALVHAAMSEGSSNRCATSCSLYG